MFPPGPVDSGVRFFSIPSGPDCSASTATKRVELGNLDSPRQCFNPRDPDRYESFDSSTAGGIAHGGWGFGFPVQMQPPCVRDARRATNNAENMGGKNPSCRSLSLDVRCAEITGGRSESKEYFFTQTTCTHATHPREEERRRRLSLTCTARLCCDMQWGSPQSTPPRVCHILVTSCGGCDAPCWGATRERRHEKIAKLSLFRSQNPLYHHARGP